MLKMSLGLYVGYLGDFDLVADTKVVFDVHNTVAYDENDVNDDCF